MFKLQQNLPQQTPLGIPSMFRRMPFLWHLLLPVCELCLSVLTVLCSGWLAHSNCISLSMTRLLVGKFCAQSFVDSLVLTTKQDLLYLIFRTEREVVFNRLSHYLPVGKYESAVVADPVTWICSHLWMYEVSQVGGQDLGGAWLLLVILGKSITHVRATVTASLMANLRGGRVCLM